MIELIYVSHAVRPFSQTELMDLLARAREYNQKKIITGLLLYDGKHTFAQALEGEEDAVRELYNTIRHDRRHTRVSLIHVHKIEQRVFNDWKMGFRMMQEEDGEGISGYSTFMNHPDRLEYLRNHPAFVPRLLYFFMHKNRAPHE